MISEQTSQEIAEMIKALNGTRWKIVDVLIWSGRATPTTLATTLGISEPAVQQHLRILQEAGLVQRAGGLRGSSVWYDVSYPTLGYLAELLGRIVTQQREARNANSNGNDTETA